MLALWDWKVTALDVGLVGALAALGAALLSPLATWLVAKVNAKNELKTRIHADRRDAYAAVLTDAYRGREKLDVILETLDDGQKVDVHRELSDAATDSSEEIAKRLSQLALFGSESVIECHGAFIDEWNRIRGEAGGRPTKTAEQRAAVSVWLRRERERLQDGLTALRRAVNADVTR